MPYITPSTIRRLVRTSRSRAREESGQSLIETIGAIFILTMALTTALGLAVYAFSRASISQNEIIATNLAREGIDVVRAMRDSNWLAGANSSDTTYNLGACADLSSQPCFPKAFVGPTYNISNSGSGGNMRLVFSSGTWTIDRATASYNLYLQADGSYTTTAPVGGGPSNFARMINISLSSAAPFTAANPKMIVKSAVAWRGKNCASFDTSQDLLAVSFVSTCRIVTEEDMTNWKDYK